MTTSTISCSKAFQLPRYPTALADDRDRLASPAATAGLTFRARACMTHVASLKEVVPLLTVPGSEAGP